MKKCIFIILTTILITMSSCESRKYNEYIIKHNKSFDYENFYLYTHTNEIINNYTLDTYEEIYTRLSDNKSLKINSLTKKDFYTTEIITHEKAYNKDFIYNNYKRSFYREVDSIQEEYHKKDINNTSLIMRFESIYFRRLYNYFETFIHESKDIEDCYIEQSGDLYTFHFKLTKNNEKYFKKYNKKNYQDNSDLRLFLDNLNYIEVRFTIEFLSEDIDDFYKIITYNTSLKNFGYKLINNNYLNYELAYVEQLTQTPSFLDDYFKKVEGLL